MNPLPWMPFYGRDFFMADDVKPLRMYQAGFYIYLLWHQWEHGFIPEFEECLHFPFVGNELYWSHRDGYSQGPAEELPLIDSLRYVFKTFFVPHPTRKKCFINKRCAAIKAEQDHQRAKKQAGGKTRASQMWPSIPSSSPTRSPSSSPVGIQSQSHNQIKKEEDPERARTQVVDKRTGQGANTYPPGAREQIETLAGKIGRKMP